jgi:hypothetical protein
VSACQGPCHHAKDPPENKVVMLGRIEEATRAIEMLGTSQFLFDDWLEALERKLP